MSDGKTDEDPSPDLEEVLADAEDHAQTEENA